MKRLGSCGVALICAWLFCGCATLSFWDTEYAKRERALMSDFKAGRITREQYEADLERLYEREEPPLPGVLEEWLGGASSDDLYRNR